MAAAPVPPRRVLIAPQRLAVWLDGFAARHGAPRTEVDAEQLVLRSPDGAVAEIDLTWGPVAGPDPLAAAVDLALRERRLGLLLVRKGSHAVGIAEGERLVVGKVGSHYVQGRTKAGGWSQQRYARRREHQAERAWSRAAADAAQLLLPELGRLEGLVLGGDAAAARAVLALPELAALVPLVEAFPRRVLPVPDPNRAVLTAFPAQVRAVPILLNGIAQTL